MTEEKTKDKGKKAADSGQDKQVLNIGQAVSVHDETSVVSGVMREQIGDGVLWTYRVCTAAGKGWYTSDQLKVDAKQEG